MIHFISHISTSRTHFLPKGEWLWCEGKGSCGLLAAAPFFPVAPGGCSIFLPWFLAKGVVNFSRFLFLPFSSFLTEVEKTPALGEMGLGIWGFARLAFQQVLIQQLELGLGLGAGATCFCIHRQCRPSTSRENLLLKRSVGITRKISREAKISQVVLF